MVPHSSTSLFQCGRIQKSVIMATQLVTQTRTTRPNHSISTFVSATIKLLPTIEDRPSGELALPLDTTKGFPISHLPAELRLKIYTEFFVSLPAIPITHSVLTEHNANPIAKGTNQSPCLNASMQTTTYSKQFFHLNNPFVLSSPFFAFDVPPYFYYRYTEFSFSCAFVLKEFATLSPLHRQIRHVRVEYGCLQRQGPDWVFLLSACFEKLESVVLVVEHLQEPGERFENWWECVKGAMREAVGEKRGNGVLVRIENECGEIVIAKLLGGHEKGI